MLFRKLIRTIGKYKAQFLSMIVMIALGVGVFVGFNIEWYSLEKDGNSYFEEQNYADYRVYSETGFSEAELEALQDIDGVDKAVRFLSVNTDVKDSKKSLTLCVTEEQGVSDFLVTEQKKDAKYGEDSKGMWLSDRYAKENNISLGDKVTVVYQGTELTEEVVGLIKSPEFAVCVSNESQIMPDYKAHGYFYISAGEVERCVGKIFYPQINILSKLSQGKIEKKVNSALGRTTYLTGKKDSLA